MVLPRVEPLNLKLLEDVVCAMDMTTPNTPPIACTLAPGEYQARLAWIAELARDALLSFERRDHVLELRYALEAADRVREMVRKERECCGFLAFELEETPREIRLTIRAPEEARGALGMLFGEFLASCGVCCVLPLALPAVALAGAGGILAWFAGAFAWVTAVAVAAVARALDPLPDGSGYRAVSCGAPVAADRAAAQDGAPKMIQAPQSVGGAALDPGPRSRV
jgi:hypothetical protein